MQSSTSLRRSNNDREIKAEIITESDKNKCDSENELKENIKTRGEIT